MRRVLLGALAGLAGTLLMTIAMEALWRRLPRRERYPLPPREIVERTLPDSIRRHSGETARWRMTMAAHFGFGAGAAIMFALLTRARSPLAGAAYGVTVWAASYLGWIPALGILRSGGQHPARRNLLMIAVHVVWGAGMAWSLRGLERVSDALESRQRLG